MSELVEGKVPATTLALVRYVVTGGRARDFVGTIDFLVEQTAAARGWRIAPCRAAAPIDDGTAEDAHRLAGRLAGRPVELQVVIDQALLSGALIRIGDLLVDATARVGSTRCASTSSRQGGRRPGSAAPVGATRRQKTQREHSDGRADDRRR